MKINYQLFFKGYDQQTAGPFQAWQILKEKKSVMSTTFTSLISPAALIRSVRTFFDLKPAPPTRCSRIRRRTNKSFDEFIFKGYDQQTPGLSRPGSFKDLKFIGKN
jgi:hypothetical protein